MRAFVCFIPFSLSKSNIGAYPSVHGWQRSVFCRGRSSVEQSSITRHCWPPLSPSSAVVLNHISFHFLITLSDSSLICTEPVLWFVILNTIVVITFNNFISFFVYSNSILNEWMDGLTDGRTNEWSWYCSVKKILESCTLSCTKIIISCQYMVRNS